MTTVDRVAGILYMNSGMNTSIVWKDVPDDWRPEFIEEAKTIIAAMREPSNKVYLEAYGSDYPDDVSAYRESWQAMIDAMLKE
jgi:hypothetical protein